MSPAAQFTLGVLIGMGLPFLVVYLRDVRRHRAYLRALQARADRGDVEAQRVVDIMGRRRF